MATQPLLQAKDAAALSRSSVWRLVPARRRRLAYAPQRLADGLYHTPLRPRGPGEKAHSPLKILNVFSGLWD